MATITKTITVWVKDDTRDVLTKKEINEIKAEMIAERLYDRDEKFDIFDNFCDHDNIYRADIMFANEESRAKILADFDKYLDERVEEDIAEWYTKREITVEFEVNI